LDTSSKSPKIGGIPGLAEFQSMWQATFGKGGNWIKGQPELLTAIDAAMQKWASHRHDGFCQTIDAWKQMSESNDLLRAVAIQQKLVADVMQGFVADWMALVDLQRLASQAHGHPTEPQPTASSKTQEAAAE
jgi:hypothetical protein